MAEKWPHIAIMENIKINCGSIKPKFAKKLANIFPTSEPTTKSGTKDPPGMLTPKAKANNNIFAKYKKINLPRFGFPFIGKNI